VASWVVELTDFTAVAVTTPLSRLTFCTVADVLASIDPADVSAVVTTVPIVKTPAALTLATLFCGMPAVVVHPRVTGAERPDRRKYRFCHKPDKRLRRGLRFPRNEDEHEHERGWRMAPHCGQRWGASRRRRT